MKNGGKNKSVAFIILFNVVRSNTVEYKSVQKYPNTFWGHYMTDRDRDLFLPSKLHLLH